MAETEKVKLQFVDEDDVVRLSDMLHSAVYKRILNVVHITVGALIGVAFMAGGFALYGSPLSYGIGGKLAVVITCLLTGMLGGIGGIASSMLGLLKSDRAATSEMVALLRYSTQLARAAKQHNANLRALHKAAAQGPVRINPDDLKAFAANGERIGQATEHMWKRFRIRFPDLDWQDENENGSR